MADTDPGPGPYARGGGSGESAETPGDRTAAGIGRPTATGLAIHAVVRNSRTDRALDALRIGGPEVAYRLVASGDLAAAVTDAPFDDAVAPDPGAVREHEAVVESLLRRASLVPAPFGLLARSEEGVRRFLERRRPALQSALEYLENSYEVRVHVRLLGEARSQALNGYLRNLNGILRGQARAARRLPGPSGEELVAAFLVGRGEWLHLVQEATRWEARNPAVELRVTGPWPPYDFVRIEESQGPEPEEES